MRSYLAWAAVVVSAVAWVGAGCATRVEAANDPEVALTRATVVVAGRCAGAVLQPGNVVLTAAHCVNETDARLPVRFGDGSEGAGEIASVDRATDMAVLYLEAPAPTPGLNVFDGVAEPGARLLYVGRPDRGERLQEVDIVRHGHCPSLPMAPVVLFTTMHGTPGDSGAPLVDSQLRIVGLVHGGARCSIAAPTWRAPEMLRAVEPENAAMTPTASR